LHLKDERLLEVLEGAKDPHVSSCAECQTRLEEARAGIALALEARVPDPSPLYWESLRRRVTERMDEESHGSRWLAPILAVAAALALAVGVFGPVSRPSPPLAAWTALPPSEEDSGLAVILALGPSPEDLVPASGCARAVDCIEGLTEEQSHALLDGLKTEISGGAR
jgi:hypothetical protein